MPWGTVVIWLLMRLYNAYRPRRPYELVAVGNCKELERRLQRGLDPNQQVKYSRKVGKCHLLHTAMFNQQYAAAGLLLQSGARADVYTEFTRATPLQVAVRLGNLALVELLLGHGADMAHQSEHGDTILVEAIHDGGQAIIRRLLAAGADPDQQCTNGVSALQLAARRGDQDLVQHLLASGASPNVADDSCWTPLCEAAYRGFTEVCRALLAAGADHTVRLDKGSLTGATPLLMAVLRKFPDAARELLAAGADPDAVWGKNKVSALHIAITDNSPVMAALLLEHGAAVNQFNGEGHTPLQLCLWTNRAERVDQRAVVAALLRAGADPNTPLPPAGDEPDDDPGGETPLMMAAYSGDIEFTTLLLEAGAQLNYWLPSTDGPGMSPLDAAVERRHSQLVAVLLGRGAQFNSSGTRESFALLHCIEEGEAGIARLLLEAGADPASAWRIGETDRRFPAIAVAVRAERLDLVELLCEFGAQLTATAGHGASLLHIAARNNTLASIDYLVDHGLAVDIQDGQGFTPLHDAAGCGSAEAVELLLRRGADANARASYGRQPLDLLGYNEERIDKKTYGRIEAALTKAGAVFSATYT